MKAKIFSLLLPIFYLAKVNEANNFICLSYYCDDYPVFDIDRRDVEKIFKVVSPIIEGFLGGLLSPLSKSKTQNCPKNESHVMEEGKNFYEVVLPVAGKSNMSLILSPGLHVIRLSKDCHFFLDIKRAFPPCSKIPKQRTSIAHAGSLTSDFEIISNGLMHRISLPVGTYKYNITDGNATCEQNIIVQDPRMRNRLVFTADYDMPCTSLLDANTKAMLQTIADSRFDHIEVLCSGNCKRLPNTQAVVTCKNDMLNVEWPTNVEFGSLKQQQDLTQSLNQQIAKYPPMLDFLSPKHTPPLVHPKQKATLLWKPSCYGGYVYDERMKTCVSP